GLDEARARELRPAAGGYRPVVEVTLPGEAGAQVRFESILRAAFAPDVRLGQHGVPLGIPPAVPRVRSEPRTENADPDQEQSRQRDICKRQNASRAAVESRIRSARSGIVSRLSRFAMHLRRRRERILAL